MIKLSESEKLFLKQGVEGKSHREIAKANFLHVRTVDSYFRIIFCKLGTCCRNEAFYLAGKQGLLD